MKTTSRIPLRRSLAAVFVAALLAALALAPSSSSPAQAQTQTVTLVSNQDQTNDATWTLDDARAVGFTTGPALAGYEMTAAQFVFASGTATPQHLSVQLWSANGSAPGSVIATLTTPATLTGGIKTFSAPAGTTLVPEHDLFHLRPLQFTVQRAGGADNRLRRREKHFAFGLEHRRPELHRSGRLERQQPQLPHDQDGGEGVHHCRHWLWACLVRRHDGARGRRV